MAIFRPGALVGAISGSLASLTYCAGPGSPHIKTRPFPRRLTTFWETWQATNRSYVTRQWPLLLDAQRLAWNRIALSIPTTDRLGRRRPMSGRTLFLRYNTQGKMTVTGVAAWPPNIYVTGPPYYFAGVFTAATYTYNVSALFAAPAANQAVVIWGARPFATTPRSSFRSWKLLAVVAAALLPFNIYSAWIARLGEMHQGETYGIRLQALDPATLCSPYVQFSGTVL